MGICISGGGLGASWKCDPFVAAADHEYPDYAAIGGKMGLGIESGRLFHAEFI
jgi:hypothetical protein